MILGLKGLKYQENSRHVIISLILLSSLFNLGDRYRGRTVFKSDLSVKDRVIPGKSWVISFFIRSLIKVNLSLPEILSRIFYISL